MKYWFRGCSVFVCLRMVLGLSRPLSRETLFSAFARLFWDLFFLSVVGGGLLGLSRLLSGESSGKMQVSNFCKRQVFTFMSVLCACVYSCMFVCVDRLNRRKTSFTISQFCRGCKQHIQSCTNEDTE